MEPIYAQGTPLAAYLEGVSSLPLSLYTRGIMSCISQLADTMLTVES